MIIENNEIIKDMIDCNSNLFKSLSFLKDNTDSIFEKAKEIRKQYEEICSYLSNSRKIDFSKIAIMVSKLNFNLSKFNLESDLSQVLSSYFLKNQALSHN